MWRLADEQLDTFVDRGLSSARSSEGAVRTATAPVVTPA